MNKVVVFAIFLFSTFLAPFAVTQADSSVKTEFVWIDVRSWVEYQVDHIDGDRQIHYPDIVSEVAESWPDKQTPIKLYCAAGVRAEKALKALQEAGYANIHNAGGIDDARRQRGLE